MKRVKKLLSLVKEFLAKHPGTNASSIAFYCFMSMVPLFILLAAMVPASGMSAQSLIAFLQNIVPDAMDDMVARIVMEAYGQSALALPLSLLMLFLVASQFVTATICGLNIVYDVEEKRSYPVLVGMSIFYTVVFMFFISVLVYLIFSDKIFQAISALVPDLKIPGEVTERAVALFMAFLGVLFFAVIYKFLPAGKRSFRDQIPGALLCTIAWYIFSFAFRIYVDHFNRFAKFYGSMATVALYLFWIYCIFYMLLAGGFVNKHCEEIRLGVLRFRKKEKH